MSTSTARPRPRTRYEPVLRLPPLPPDQYTALHDHIAVHGVLVPILVDAAGPARRVIDGWNRKRIADGLGYDCPEVVQAGLTEGELRTLARALNLARRQLSIDQKRQLIADQLAETPQRSNRWVARQLGVSHPTVASVRAELETTGRLYQFGRTLGADGKYRPSGKGFHYERGHCGFCDTWLTPPSILRALGPFDLDPCAPGGRRPWDTARQHYTASEDGLRRRWSGRVWLNPPYGPALGDWLGRLADHGDGIALVYARTDAGWFFDWVWERASGLLFLRGRVSFCDREGVAVGTATAPSVLASYDRGRSVRNRRALEQSGLAGMSIALA